MESLTAHDLSARRRLDVVFGLLLASGLSVDAVCLLAIAFWVKPQGEAAFGVYLLAIATLAPTVLAWLASGLQSFMAPRDRHVRLGAALVTAHLVWWLMLIGLLTLVNEPGGSLIVGILLVEPVVYGPAATYLGARWFWSRRGDFSGQVAADPAPVGRFS